MLINIEQNDDCITGRISLYETAEINGDHIPYWTWSFLKGKTTDSTSFEGDIGLPSIHTHNGDELTVEQLDEFKQVSGIAFPHKTTVKANQIDSHMIEVEWESFYDSDITREDSVTLVKEKAIDSRVDHEKMSWGEFKDFALNQGEGIIYRGQERAWRLQTSFHRTGHADLISYLDTNLAEVEHHINAYSEHVYDIQNDRSLGALLNLAQHHGYPTPLLDWTKSPYVAAFFAYQNNNINDTDDISIFWFNQKEWTKKVGNSAQIKRPGMTVRTMELPGFGNLRVLPQQAMTMYSNVDDIEYILKHFEDFPGQLLRAISIPKSDRDAAIRDLGLMGITWGSMFPGLDGICRQLKARHFFTD